MLGLAEVEVFGGTGDSLGGLIRTDLTGSMQGHNATLLVRIPFGIPVEEMPALDRLTLRVKYDDGFVAYLNGVEIARRNAPATLFWNSVATAEHSLPGALQFEEIVIPRLAKAVKIPIDANLISVVPLGGRHVDHFWKLLHSLDVLHLTLLDFDRERLGGGWGRIHYACSQLIEAGVPNLLMLNGGRCRIRTCDLLRVKQTL